MAKILVTGGSGFIGIHLVSELESRGHSVFNLDLREPVNGKRIDFWIRGSVLDLNLLQNLVVTKGIEYIIHLAALAKQNASSIEEFEVNIEGTRNVISTVNANSCIKRVIYTSTQYVNSPGLAVPESLDKYRPYGFYGASKLIGEFDVRDRSNKVNWLIIRPTAIWGEHHPVLTWGLWWQIYKKRYFHPSNDKAIKPYGFVKNTAWQIAELIDCSDDNSHGSTFYLADELVYQRSWVANFITQLNGNYLTIPRTFLKALSKIGDVMIKMGVNFPLYSSRYNNLITSNPVDIYPIINLLGIPPHRKEIAIEEVCAWLKLLYKEKGYISHAR